MLFVPFVLFPLCLSNQFTSQECGAYKKMCDRSGQCNTTHGPNGTSKQIKQHEHQLHVYTAIKQYANTCNQLYTPMPYRQYNFCALAKFQKHPRVLLLKTNFCYQHGETIGSISLYMAQNGTLSCYHSNHKHQKSLKREERVGHMQHAKFFNTLESFCNSRSF